MLLSLQILLLLLLVACSAFFSSAEISLFSLPRAKVLAWKDSGDPIQRTISRLMENYNCTLVTIILGNMFVNSAISMLNDSILKHTGLTGAALTVLSVITAVVLLLLFGEITPMSLAYVFCEPWSRIAARPVMLLRKFLAPAVFVMDRLSGFVLDLLGRTGSCPLTADEYDSYVEICGKKGAFTREEVTLLRETLDFADKDASEVMRPRNTLGFLREDLSAEEAAEKIRTSRQKYLLVGKRGPDDADRIMDAVRFFMLSPEGRSSWSSSDAVFPAVFIPEETSVMHAIRTLRRSGHPAGLLSDEYGGISGLVAADELFMHFAADEKLLKRISEYGLRKVSETAWDFDGTTPLDIAEEKLALSLEDFESNTLNGVLSELLGHLPVEGETAMFEGFRFQALTVKRNHADRIRIEKVSQEEQAS